jgi:protein transport protein SEC20
MTSASTAWDHEPTPIDSDRVIDKIGQMVEESEGSAIDDITPEERARQEALPRNPKKRMFEAEVVEQVRDEL